MCRWSDGFQAPPRARSIVFDGRVIVENNYRTADKHIYAAGPIAMFSRRHVCRVAFCIHSFMTLACAYVSSLAGSSRPTPSFQMNKFLQISLRMIPIENNFFPLQLIGLSDRIRSLVFWRAFLAVFWPVFLGGQKNTIFQRSRKRCKMEKKMFKTSNGALRMAYLTICWFSHNSGGVMLPPGGAPPGTRGRKNWSFSSVFVLAQRIFWTNSLVKVFYRFWRRRRVRQPFFNRPPR